MTSLSVNDRILAHAGLFPDAPEGEWFLANLRPYVGLDYRVFSDFADALVAISRTPKEVDVYLSYALWSACYYARLWGVAPEGMLQRNKLVSASEGLILARWCDVIEQSSLALLRDQEYVAVAKPIVTYIAEGREVHLTVEILSGVQQLLTSSTADERLVALLACEKLGFRAVDALAAVQRLVDDPDEEVRDAAEAACKVIAHRDEEERA